MSQRHRQAPPPGAGSAALADVLQAASLNGVYVLDLPAGVAVQVNDAFTRLTGYAAAEIDRLGAGAFAGLVHPDDRARLEAHLAALGADAAADPADIELRLRGARGGHLHCLCRHAVLDRDADGGLRRVVGTCLDLTAHRQAGADRRAGEVTEERRTLAALAETNERWRLVADYTYDWEYWVGGDGRLRWMAPSAERITGYPVAAFAADPGLLAEITLPEDRPLVHDHLRADLREQAPQRLRFRIRRADGAERWLEHICQPVYGADGRFAGRRVSTRDITDAKAVEAALREASRRKDDFLAFLGHELRNPMAPIRNAVEILHLLVRAPDPRLDWALGVLDRQTEHLSRLLDDLLDISRIVRGRLKLDSRIIPLREVIQQAADGVRPLMLERHHRFEVALPSTQVLVEGDPVRLAQILLNLLLNAATYTPAGGSVRVAVEVDDGEALVRVQDDGPGIPPERIDALFRPFSREDGAECASPGGLGLGLAISRRLAELHGGRLVIHSDWPRPGTELTLYLPRVVRGGPLPDPRPAPERGAAEPLHVLVVDDNADVAGALAMLLRVLGYRVETAASGAEALAAAERNRPRVAFLDIGLPDMDGLEVARRLRRRFPHRDELLLVAVTGYGHDEARGRSFAAGFDEHLAKPVDRRTLQALLERVSGGD